MTHPRGALGRAATALLALASSLPVVTGFSAVACARGPASGPSQPTATALPPPASARATSSASTADARPSAQGPLEPSRYLSSLTVTEDRALAAGEVVLEVRRPDGPFGELTRRGLAGSLAAGELRLRLPTRYPAFSDAPIPRDRACSFVIDCDDPAVRDLELPPALAAPEPTGVGARVAKLISFTGAHITRKTMTRGFDVASQVARSGEGDCSEHAVLLAALARRLGLPARVVLGLALLEFEHRPPLVMGHAWAEVHDGSGWGLADAALPAGELGKVPGLTRVVHLPVQVLAREDVGYSSALFGQAGVLHVSRVRIAPPG